MSLYDNIVAGLTEAIEDARSGGKFLERHVVKRGCQSPQCDEHEQAETQGDLRPLVKPVLTMAIVRLSVWAKVGNSG